MDAPLLFEPWNNFLTSSFAVDVESFADADTDVDADCEGDGLPFTAGSVVGCAVTEPNVLGASDLMGGTDAGEEDSGAEASSIEPKVTEPDFGAPTGLRAPTPSLKTTPC